MVEIYVLLIKSGKKTIDDVPLSIRDLVKEKLEKEQ